MMQVAVQRHHLPLAVQEHLRHGGGPRQDATIPRGGWLQLAEPDLQRHQPGRWYGPRRVQGRQNAAKDAGGLLVTPLPRELGQRPAAGRTFEEQRVAVLCQHPCCTLPVPPRQHYTAELLLGLVGDLEHGGDAMLAHWKQLAGMGQDRVAVGLSSQRAR